MPESNPFTQAAQTTQAQSNSDYILIVILLAIMLFFLMRNLSRFKSEGLKVTRPSDKAKVSDDEGDDDEEEEEEEAEEVVEAEDEKDE